MKVVAKKINRRVCDYITEGKPYDVVSMGGLCDFNIIDDDGESLPCVFMGDNHILADWTIIGNPAVAIPLDEYNKLEK